ncbi:Glycosyl hydrolase family 47 protein [Trichomonas vaginalis G3]|uniref:alpha-1,2-Mannosidase n=1 Tax=Trichomonas vaginalis (strain ATCC PRA-98 / G3) TaxID=412133 RepID=A2FBR1_TRIV3|nr:glycosyl hydrolase [Trichomonas vaginalis G3]EAX97658.1 Glycosyl hydrolase family 47 protein [Trichomonas vaginalis G3]KAI5510375.1 mannosyl-oligosaccharide 1,2-alpha-mannosidase protein [Trichomonas vaginalis G3]|eukprot:XP_001310588.1 glycosyl hydrolase [Trichomonas vaginalis G3]
MTLNARSNNINLYNKFNRPIDSDNDERREKIKDAFLYAWNIYKKNCWGYDFINTAELRCFSYLNSGLTIVDSLSTLILMNLTNEYEDAKNFVEKNFTLRGSWKTFEVIIRYLGSFISSYELTHEEVFKNKSIIVMNLIDSLLDKNGFLLDQTDFNDSEGYIKVTRNYGDTQLALLGTLQLECLSIAKITGNDYYVQRGLNFWRYIWKMYPNESFIFDSYQYQENGCRDIGRNTDSYYEYILKSYLLTNRKSKTILDRHLLMMKEIKRYMYYYHNETDIYFVGKSCWNVLYGDDHHLTTFLGGLIGIGAIEENPNRDEDFEMAKNLTDGYYKMYRRFKTGLMPELPIFLGNGSVSVEFSSYFLRPETVESIYYIWKLTGDKKYREMAWNIFLSIDKYCKCSNGYSAIDDVDSENPTKTGYQDSYFFSETLKYLYLTFCDRKYLPLSEWVFNTEGHPLRVWSDEDFNLLKTHLFE